MSLNILFFFQAEDGIRDIGVTGVQTCALPIYRDRFVLRVFQMEVAMQCRFALMAYNEVRTALLQGDDNRVWFALQALLVASSNVSKLLWPIKQMYSKQRAVLRATLGIDDTSALKPPCTLRDHLEHFDEQLEAWTEELTRHNFV